MTTPDDTHDLERRTVLSFHASPALYAALRAVQSEHPGVSMHRLTITLLHIALTIATDHPDSIREHMAELFPPYEPSQAV